jgi:hypothetical protein
MSLVFATGTGRCGSTMLSRLLQMHPKILSLNEFWSIPAGAGILSDDYLVDNDYLLDTVSGQEFWQRIIVPDALIADALYAEIRPLYAEIRPYGNRLADSRFNPESGVPVIMRILIWITGDPDALYDRLAIEVPGWPPRPMIEHCRVLFDRLANLTGRPFAVERSGASLRALSMLHRHFPEARFVFLYREGPDTVLSMSRHFIFRLMYMKTLERAVRDSSSWLSQYPEIASMKLAEFKALSAPPFDEKRLMEFPLPRALLARMWSNAMCEAANEFRKMPPDRWMTLRYERLLTATRPELTRLLDFLGAPVDPVMLDSACDAVDRGRSGRAAAVLHPVERAEIQNACTPGAQAFELLDAEHG